MSKGFGIVLYSGRADSLILAGVLAQTAANYEIPVRIFVTSFATPYFMREKPEPKVPEVFQDLAERMMQGMAKMGAPSWYEMLKTAKELGDVRIMLCSMTMEALGYSKDQIDPIVDDIVGAATFLAEMSDYQVVFV
ncbi:MAG: DsrE/DsrF/DrsH-like family protein [Candidatus Korarchaeota archaeon]|nr:DsrE/DsrF/DrsH-like family protein [Candidatus Korarchaeota archaeon]MDK2384648.1 DsrE/DsrF/DrsH-like family protein [Candidatus Korarchaeota archaeon]